MEFYNFQILSKIYYSTGIERKISNIIKKIYNKISDVKIFANYDISIRMQKRNVIFLSLKH